MNKDMHKDMHKTGWMQPPAPFGGPKWQRNIEGTNLNQIDWVVKSRPHPLTGIAKAEKKESE